MSQKIGDFRESIQNLIQASENSGDAAALVCFFIEDKLDLAGNGWFDDDSLLGSDEDDDELQSEDEEDNLYDYDTLYKRMKRLQFSPLYLNWAAQVGQWIQGSNEPEVEQKLVETVRKNNDVLREFTVSDLESITPQLRAIFDGVVVGTPDSVNFLYQCIDVIASNGERGSVEMLPAIAQARLGAIA